MTLADLRERHRETNIESKEIIGLVHNGRLHGFSLRSLARSLRKRY